MARNVSRSIVVNTRGGVKHGKVLSDKHIIDKRKQACEKCEHYSGINSRCSVCGCFVNIKVSLLYEKCPTGKW